MIDRGGGEMCATSEGQMVPYKDCRVNNKRPSTSSGRRCGIATGNAFRMSTTEGTVGAGKVSPRKKRTSNAGENGQCQAKRSKQEAKNEFEEVMAKVKGDDKEVAVKFSKKLKTLLPNRTKIEAFVGHKKNLEDLVAVFSRETSLLGTSLYNEDLHKYAISIIGNCCFTDKTPATGFQIKKAQRNFLDLAVRIFESTTSNIEIRISMCRLIGNLCNSKELVTSWLSSNTILFDRIALLLESTNESIVTQCLRIFLCLANHSFTRVIMLSNAGFYLGKLLTKKERRSEVVKILKVLLKRHMNVLDRQLSSSACSEQVVEMFFEKNSRNRQFVIDLFSNSVCIREQMETETFIDQLLACSIPEKNRMLAAFSQTAWGRAKLRTSGALDALIDVFSASELIDEKLSIVAAFRHFVHDTAGMRHLSENSTFVNTVVRDVNVYVDKNRSDCQPTVDIEFVRTLRRENDGGNQDGQASNNVEAPLAPLHKDFYSMWSYDTPQTSPRRAQSASMSPQYNSPSPSYSFPSSVASSPAASPAAKRHSEGILDELSDVESDNEHEEKQEEEEAEKVKKKERNIVDGELWLLTWLAQDDYNLQFLIRPDVVDCVVAYLRSTSSPDFRTYRALRRMATHRTHVYRLLDLQFHVRILTGLCASPCRMLKYARPCKQCDTCSEHGREILREFASHVDNSYGDAHINTQFTREDFVHRTKAAIAKIVLVKERVRLAKVPALTELFNALAHVMSSPENFEELGKMPTYENGPSFASQIIGALSILISGQKIKELCEHDMWYFPVEEGKGTCLLAEEESGEEMLHFVDERNQPIVAAPMKKVCENSHYFEGMYSSDFVEKTEGIRTFQVQSESCRPEDFRLFIHLLSTCSASCTTVSSAEQCATLLALSDQFLCPRISEQLCADDGPVRTFLNGRSLQTLLPVALATNAHPTLLDTVYLTLVRFSSSEDVTRALETICANTTVVNTFVTSLRTFLTTKC